MSSFQSQNLRISRNCLIDPYYLIGGTSLLLCASVYPLFKAAQIIKLSFQMSRQMRRAESLGLSIESFLRNRQYFEKDDFLRLESGHYLQNQLVYISGQIQKRNTQQSIDQYFGVKTDAQSLGLFRKVEYLTKSQQYLLPKYEWMFHQNSQIQPNGLLSIENYKIDKDLLLEIAEQYSNQIKLDANTIDSRFDEIKSSFQNLQSSSVEDLYTNHPFKQAIDSSKQIYYKNDYIYISKDLDRQNEGDFRISFHQMQNLAEVTLFSAASSISNKNKSNIIEGTLNIFKNRLQNEKLSVTITGENNTKRVVKLDEMRFILKGTIPQQEAINIIKSQIRNKSVNLYFLYAVLLFGLYTIVEYECAGQIDCFNEAQTKAAASKMISFDNKFTIEISKDYSKFSNDSIIRSLTQTGIHLGSVFFSAYGRIFFPLWGIYFLITEGQMIINRIQIELEVRKKIEEIKSSIRPNSVIYEHELLKFVQNLKFKN